MEDRSEEVQTDQNSNVSSNNESQHDLTRDAKLQAINKELGILLHFCASKDFSERQVVECMNLFTGRTPQPRREQRTFNWVFYFVLAVSIVFGVCLTWEPAYNQVCIHSRIVFVKVIKYWNLEYLYDMDCITENPFIAEQELGKEDCQACLDVASFGIDRLSNASAVNVTKNYLFLGLPVFIEDGLRNWSHLEHFDLDHLFQVYKTRDELKDLESCMFYSTVSGQQSIYDFFRDVEEKNISDGDYYVSWENCKSNAAKFIRRLYRRPYFLSRSTELGIPNQIHIGKGLFSAKEHAPDLDENDKILKSDAQGSWLAVISGTMQVELTPLTMCEQYGCQNHTVYVQAGEMFAVSGKMFLYNWAPHSKDVTVAVSSEIFWFES